MINKGTDYSMAILANLQNQGPVANIKDLFDTSKLGDFGKLEDLLKGDKSKKINQKPYYKKLSNILKHKMKITLRNLTYGGGELAASRIICCSNEWI